MTAARLALERVASAAHLAVHERPRDLLPERGWQIGAAEGRQRAQRLLERRAGGARGDPQHVCTPHVVHQLDHQLAGLHHAGRRPRQRDAEPARRLLDDALGHAGAAWPGPADQHPPDRKPVPPSPAARPEPVATRALARRDPLHLATAARQQAGGPGGAHHGAGAVQRRQAELERPQPPRYVVGQDLASAADGDRHDLRLPEPGGRSEDRRRPRGAADQHRVGRRRARVEIVAHVEPGFAERGAQARIAEHADPAMLGREHGPDPGMRVRRCGGAGHPGRRRSSIRTTAKRLRSQGSPSASNAA